MWIARDKDDTLWLYADKPIKKNDYYDVAKDETACFWDNEEIAYNGYVKIHNTLYPEVTWKNSPKELIIKQDGL